MTTRDKLRKIGIRGLTDDDVIQDLIEMYNKQKILREVI